MKEISVLFITVIFISTVVCAQSGLSQSDWKMTQAKQLIEDNKFNDALTIYQEIHVSYPDDDFLNYRIAYCLYRSGDDENAIKFVDQALTNCKNCEILGEVHYLKAQINHSSGDYDLALESLDKISGGIASADSLQIYYLSKQISNAILYSSNPSKFILVNCSEVINSSFNEFYPVYSAASEKLYFTSDRQINDKQEKSSITHAYPFSIFETVINNDRSFGSLVTVDETFATGKNYILNAVSAGDMDFYLYCNTPEDLDKGDLYSDTKDVEEDFTDPVRINGTLINTEFYEGAASYDYINEQLYFVSTRKDKLKQNSDIFVSKLFKNKFSEPSFLKSSNTDNDEAFVYVNPGGDFMVISAENEKSCGGYDLFISFLKDGKWTDPENMGFPINSAADETQFCLSADAKTAFIASDRKGGFGGFDIYSVDFEKYIMQKLEYLPAIIFVNGQVRDDKLNGVEAEIKIVDKSDSKKIQTFKTDSEGFYFTNLRCNSWYSVEVKSKSFAPISSIIDLTGVMSGERISNFELIPRK